MKWDMNRTPLVIFILFIVAGIYDFACVVFGGASSSISNTMINIGFKSPLVVFVCGLIAGHLWFYMYPVTEKKNEDKKATSSMPENGEAEC